MPIRQMFLLFCRIFVELKQETGAGDPFRVRSEQAFVDYDPLCELLCF
jgi:hypothetical protein